MIAECDACHARYDVRGHEAGTQLRCRCGSTFEVRAMPGLAEHVACPTCGAAASVHASRCGYCQAPLSVASCPRCFGMMSTGARFCPHCGTSTAKPIQAVGRQSTRSCPRCRTRLTALAVGGTFLEQCQACEGLFLETQTFDSLVDEEDRRALLETSLPKTAVKPAGDLVRYIPCPECGILMHRSNFGRRSGIILDVCKQHGTWFDADELRRVVDFVKSGGLDQARQKELAEIKHQIAHQRQIAQQTLGGSGLGVEPSGSFWPGVDLLSILGGIVDLMRD